MRLLAASGALFTVLLGGCSERRPATQRGEARSRTSRKARPRPTPPTARSLHLGATSEPTGLQGMLPGVRLGMRAAALRAARPRAYQSRSSGDLFHETLAGNLSAHYTFHRGALYSVLLRQYGGAGERARLLREARSRWGKPSPIETARLFRAPGALVRVDTDLGNLIYEVTRDRPNGPEGPRGPAKKLPIRGSGNLPR